MVDAAVTRFKILPKALDTEEGMEIVSVHKTILFVAIVGCLCLTLIVTMLVVRHIHRRRLLDPEFYKRRGNENSSAALSAREEFSEIRYLTEDEQLDFALATPSTFKPQTMKVKEEEKEEKKEEIPKNKSDKKEKKEEKESKKKKNHGKSAKKVPCDEADNEGLLGDEDYGDDDHYEEFANDSDEW